MSSKFAGLGLKVRFGLTNVGGYNLVSSEKLYNDALNHNQARIDKIRNLGIDIPTSLSDQKNTVVRIFGEVQTKAGVPNGVPNYAEAVRQFNDELLYALTRGVEMIDAFEKKKKQFKDRVDAEKAKITALKTGPNAVIHPDLDAVTNDKIQVAEASFAAPQFNDAPGLRLLDEAAVAIEAAKRLLAESKDYAAKLATSESLLNGLNIPANKLIHEDLAEIQKTKIDEAKKLALPATRDYAGAKRLLAEADAACNKSKDILDKVASAKSSGKKLFVDTSRFLALKAHAQANAFQTDITGLQKQVNAGKANIDKGLVVAANRLFLGVHWDAARRIKEADAHGLHVTERDGPVKIEMDKLPTATGTVIDDEVAVIKKTHAAAEVKAGKRLYDAAMALLAEAKKQCLAALSKQAEHKAYDDVLQVIEQPVAALPPDTDKVIGPEAKAVRARLQTAKDAATNRDFVAAKKLADQAQTELAAAQKLAEDAAKHAEASKKAVEQAKPDDALAEVRKLWTSLTSKDTDKVVETLLKTIDDRLKEAAEALKA